MIQAAWQLALELMVWDHPPHFDYSEIYSVLNAEYPCTQRFLVAQFGILWGKISFFEPATNPVCVWKSL
jgi:hypothetical protein